MLSVHRDGEPTAADDSVELPSLAELLAVAGGPGNDRVAPLVDGEPVRRQLTATYFDTADRRLAKVGMTLRRRVGGEDDGWQLTFGAGPEVNLPLARGARTVPVSLRKMVWAQTLGTALRSVAEIGTDRRVYHLVDGAGQVVGEAVDDRITARRLTSHRGEDAADVATAWRQIGLQLGDGNAALETAVEARLRELGLLEMSNASRVAQLLGLDGIPAAGSEPWQLTVLSPAGEVVLAHVRDQVRQLQAQDLPVRLDAPDSIHKMRVAVRRMRSALTTFKPLFTAEVIRPVRGELRWLAGELGAARDAEVLRDRVRAALEAEPEAAWGPVDALPDGELSRSYRTAHDRVLVELDGRRYQALLMALDGLVRSPPWTERAAAAAGGTLPRMVASSYARVSRLVAEADAAPDRAEREKLLHDARKAAKQARYAGESVSSIFGADATAFAEAMEDVQEALGEHQDSVLARARLRDLAMHTSSTGAAFLYGRLHALEQAQAHESRQHFDRAWEAAATTALHRWPHDRVSPGARRGSASSAFVGSPHQGEDYGSAFCDGHRARWGAPSATPVPTSEEEPPMTHTGTAMRKPTLHVSANVDRARRVTRGKVARAEVPRESHAEFAPGPDRADPLALLEGQGLTREPSLLPIRYGRMAASAFAFYRGAALPMASDLAETPRSGLMVQACGDAHLANFGLFASPERHLVFDINDFDETNPGPWEWDVKRLATSLEIAGRTNDYPAKVRRDIVLAAVAAYRRAMRSFADMDALGVWYAHADIDRIQAVTDVSLTARQRKTLSRTAAKAQTKDNLGALGRFATIQDGAARLNPAPPLIVPLRDLIDDPKLAEETENGVRQVVHAYAETLEPERRVLLDRYRLVDIARKVVGVGSVGTRSWMILLLEDGEYPLFLQAKEAGPSVLEAFVGASEYDNAGQRVVVGQRLMQAVSDIFLGWVRVTGLDGPQRDFYLRQLRDWKGSAEVETMVPAGVRAYGELCGWTLARAHARSGDRVAMGAYLGNGPAFDVAVREFAEKYADQNERDHQALVAAITAGTIAAEAGV